ncbi:hypothetical protein T11_13796 [Trichinella zimbabwensis]|uniref:Uncharacterized protein n=1 Tax=Trichinella zimbabwensis TaxID=268475 RepID=A0A0V1H5E4_9BILA|nr:hypothetical protein T11_13796 [Trichinella zimbabwensis]
MQSVDDVGSIVNRPWLSLSLVHGQKQGRGTATPQLRKQPRHFICAGPVRILFSLSAENNIGLFFIGTIDKLHSQNWPVLALDI